METTEQWKMIEGFDLYEVSNTGKVRSKDRITLNGSGSYLKRGRVMNPVDNGNGYLKVDLKQDGRKKRAYVHRLVATAFIPNPERKPFVNHIDNNPTNNSIHNLEWCTPQENMDWMHLQGRATRTEQWLEHLHKSQEKIYKPVLATNITTGEQLYFEKLNDVKKLGFFPSSVCRCCKGEAIQHKGFKWEYV